MSLSDDGGYGGDGHRGSETGQTRTRLPDNDGDIYGSGRRPRAGMSSRNLVTIVGVIVLLLAAIAFANRGGSGNSETPAGDSAKDAPTTPSPPPPPAPSRSPARTAASPRASPRRSRGRSRRRRIMRWRSVQRRHVLKPTDGTRSSEHVYRATVAAARKNDLDKAYSTHLPQAARSRRRTATRPQGMTFVSRTNPSARRLESFKGDTAKVSKSGTPASSASAGDRSPRTPVTESWFTIHLQLQWAGGDWKVDDFTQKDGPAPIGRDQTAASADDMTKAVQGFGGFTYAR